MQLDDIKILPDLQFSILCDDVRREHNGKLILLGLFETIGAQKFPVLHPSLYIVNRWCNGVGSFKQKTEIYFPDNKLMAEDAITDVRLDDLKSKHTIIARFNNLRFPVPGEYGIEIHLDADTKIRYPMMIVQSRRQN